MPDILFSLFGKRIIRKAAENAYRPKGFDGMVQAFNGPDGRIYYTWPDLGDLPAIRTKQIERTMIWLDARTTRKSLEEYGEDQAKALATICKEKDEQKRWAASTKLGALYQELILRGNAVVPEFLYYDLAATLAIADNENPHTWDAPTHERKKQMMMDGAREGAAFFLGLPILKSLLGSYLSSEEGFKELLTSWMMREARKKQARQVLS